MKTEKNNSILIIASKYHIFNIANFGHLTPQKKKHKKTNNKLIMKP